MEVTQYIEGQRVSRVPDNRWDVYESKATEHVHFLVSVQSCLEMEQWAKEAVKACEVCSERMKGISETFPSCIPFQDIPNRYR